MQPNSHDIPLHTYEKDQASASSEKTDNTNYWWEWGLPFIAGGWQNGVTTLRKLNDLPHKPAILILAIYLTDLCNYRELHLDIIIDRYLFIYLYKLEYTHLPSPSAYWENIGTTILYTVLYSGSKNCNLCSHHGF